MEFIVAVQSNLIAAVKLAQGRYIARMDADDISYPQRLEKQFCFLERHPDVDLLGTAVMLFRSDGSTAGVRRSPCGHQEICAQPWLRMPVIHSSWMGRSDWFRRNPYRADSTRVEDWELLRRVYPSCRFANLEDVLMGVREDTLSLRQQMTARKELRKYALDSSWRNEDFEAAKTIFAQLPRTVLDLVAIFSGLGCSMLPRGSTPATPREIADWNAVWETLKPEEKKIAHSA